MVWFEVNGISGAKYCVRSDKILNFGYDDLKHYTTINLESTGIKCQGNIVPQLKKAITRIDHDTIVPIEEEQDERN